MTNVFRVTLWFVVPFGITLLIASAFVAGRGERDALEFEGRDASQSNALQLVGRTISTAELIEAQSRASIVEHGVTMPDTAVVILLGAIGCSKYQMEVLQYWSEPPAGTDTLGHPVLAIYADPLVGPAAGAYESLILRRVSRATFPFFVSTDTTFNPRAMNIRTPQVVFVESGVITKVFDSTPGLQPSFPVLQSPPS